MAKKKGTLEETYQLPSLGKLYGEGSSSEVSIRSMTTFEEKMRLGSQGFWKTMTSILESVVTYPEDFKVTNLTLFDFYFLMYKMRTVSYGPIYKVSVTCPHCGNTMISKVNLDDISIDYLNDENSMEPITIGPLPRSGDTLQCKYLRVQDSMSIERRSKEILRDHPDYVGDPSYILTMASEIKSINGEDKLPIEVQMYVEQMSAMDSAYFQQAYNKLTNKVGMNTVCHDVCDHCGEELSFGLPFNSEFFRPTFDF